MSVDESVSVLTGMESAVDNEGWSALVAGLPHAAALKIIKAAVLH